MTHKYNSKNVINYPFIDYIIKSYVPSLQTRKINMRLFEESMLHITTKFNDDQPTYERLEYLGDAIFHMIITEYIYQRYEDANEGFLTRLRIRIERGDSMADLTRTLQLEYYIQVMGISINDHILEDVFEAFVGAFYLNFGLKYTREFIVKLIEKNKNLSEMIAHDDNYKDILLRYFHQMKWGHPIYSNEKSDNIKNNRKFVIIVKNPSNKILGRGSAITKKKAEQLASKHALEKLGVIIDDELDVNWLDKIEKIEIDGKDKNKKNKKTMSVFNPKNKQMKKTDIKRILNTYNICLKRDKSINLRLFREAMTHRSYLIRKNLTEDDKVASKNCVKLQKKSNERLQFLGDSIIHFVIGEYLYHKYPSADEGFLTRLRCKLENRDTLFYLATQTGVSEYLLVSQNIEILHGRKNVNIIGGGFESFIGAIYLEIGMSTVRELILEIMRLELDIKTIAEKETNYKDLLLQIYNKNKWGHPDYRVIREEGPDHSKIFTMGIYFRGKLVSKGCASSKKKAEQIASRIMYEKWISKDKNIE